MSREDSQQHHCIYEIPFISVLMGEAQCQNTWSVSHANYSWWLREGSRHREQRNEEIVLCWFPEQGGDVPGRRSLRPPWATSAFSAPTGEVPLAAGLHLPRTGGSTLRQKGAHPSPSAQSFSVSLTCCLQGALSLASLETRGGKWRGELERSERSGQGPWEAGPGCPSAPGHILCSLWAAGKWEFGKEKLRVPASAWIAVHPSTNRIPSLGMETRV